MKKLIITVFGIFNIILSTAQDRGAIYVHGLGENANEWAQWRALFNQERRMLVGSNNPYTSTTGVANFANQVPTPANNNTIIFGHSAGGVVARHIERTRTNPFGGIITAGSPLDGAKVSNNLANGQASSYIVNSVDKVLKGPIRDFGQALGVIYEVAGHRLKSYAEAYVNEVLNDMLGGATATDLAEGSAYMNNGWRQQASTMPKIHIYGNENAPVLFRIATAALGLAPDELVGKAQTAYDVCHAAELSHRGLAFTDPFHAIQHNWIADGWKSSADWINGGGETGWNDLIGASIPASITTSSQVLDYNQLNQCLMQYAPQATYEQYMQCQQQSTSTVYYTTYSPVNGRSDGFIKAPSQSGFNSTWSNNATKVEALGVNHLEMRNHAEILAVYRRIFNGQVPGQSAFYITPIR